MAAFEAGKLVIVYLTKPVECLRYTGETTYSGTGRNRVATKSVMDISSYEAVPNLGRVTAKSGTEIRLGNDAKYLIPYWTKFSRYSPYEVQIDGKFNSILLKSRAGDRTVGAAIHGKNGTLLFLPPLRYDEDKFTRYDGRKKETFWTDEANKFGKQLSVTLAALADNLKQSTQSTPAPDWSLGSEYRLAEEGELESAISNLNDEISELQAKKTNLEAKLQESGILRRLLFEQGKPLELTVLEALKLFGFKAEQFSDGESQFDAVFVSPEGRCLGEAEGKDSKAINIDKFSQLERNLQEDFARDDVKEYAKGVLFGNAHRLSAPTERGDFFTQKCVSAAKRTRAALVRTSDLFGPAKYLKENQSDRQYAKQCREAIFGTEGDIVTFPSPPISETKTLTASKKPRKAKKSDVPVDVDE